MALVQTLYPASATAAVSPPAYRLEGGVAGPNGTSANVTVEPTRGPLQLLVNPDLYTSQEGWYCSPGSSITCYYLPGDQGASGGAALIYGQSTQTLASDSGYVYQVVEMPNSTISSAVAYVTSRDAGSTGLLVQHQLVVYDLGSQQVVYTAALNPGSTYSTEAVDITGYVQPGKRYAILVGVYVIGLYGFTVDYRVDSVYLYVSTEDYTYTGAPIAVNATSNASAPALAELALLAADAPPGFNATIYIANATGAETGRITIVNGEPATRATGWVEVSPAPPGYASARVHVSITTNTTDPATLYCYLVVCSGYCALYPVKLQVNPG